MPIMIEIVLLDVDGVLTDGTVYIDSEGKESKRIAFDDIDAVFELKRAGIKIGFLTGEDNNFSEYVKKRFAPDYFVSGCKDKLSYFKRLSEDESIDKSKVCFVGDSTKDIELLKYLDFSFSPTDVSHEIKESAKFVTHAARGKGVIKEVAAFVLNRRKTVSLLLPMQDLWHVRLREHAEVINLLQKDENLFMTVMEATKVIVTSLSAGGKLLICGNGGSAADSQHLATELVSRFFMERKALDAEALTVNTSTLTAIGNDYSFAKVFSRQVEAKGKPGDVLLAISTSGTSENVIEAIKAARKMNLTIIGMTGDNLDSPMHELADYCICVPAHSTPRIQECHILIGHIMCEIIEQQLFGK